MKMRSESQWKAFIEDPPKWIQQVGKVSSSNVILFNEDAIWNVCELFRERTECPSSSSETLEFFSSHSLDWLGIWASESKVWIKQFFKRISNGNALLELLMKQHAVSSDSCAAISSCLSQRHTEEVFWLHQVLWDFRLLSRVPEPAGTCRKALWDENESWTNFKGSSLDMTHRASSWSPNRFV